MGTLHVVTQLRPFVLSGDGAFLPVLSGCEKRLEAILVEHTENENRWLRVPASIEHADPDLKVHGIYTQTRSLSTDRGGAFLFIESGGKNGYGTLLSKLIEAAVECLDDFWFVVFWNNQFADEYVYSGGKLEITWAVDIPTRNYDDHVADRLKSEPVLLHSYFLDSALWAKRWYEADLAEYGPEETEMSVEEFPDAIETLKRALEIMPEDPASIALLEWYKQHVSQSDG